MRRNIFYRKIPAALAAFVLALALCCQTAAAGRALVPGGYTVGIKLYAEGLMVTEVESGTPAQQAGIRKGDVIIAADGKKTDSAQALLGSIQKSEPIVVRVERGGREAEFLVTPEKTPSGYRLGVLVRDHIAGIGTVTYYDPVSLQYGALGHGITDVDTAQLMPLASGSIMETTVKAVKKGRKGDPGELKGDFTVQRDVGTVTVNSNEGIFGTVEDAGFISGEAVSVAEPEEVHAGEASILCTISGSDTRAYEVEILRVNPRSRDGRDLLLRVTDPELLETTGGIVQGMSGSPILQDGRLVGAVTHVLVANPAEGYGIFLENMLTTAG